MAVFTQYNLIALYLILIVEIINGFKVEVQTAEVHCKEPEVEQIVDWHPITLSEYFNEGEEDPLKISPQLNGAMAQNLQNDFELKIFKSCNMKLVITLKIVNDNEATADGVLIDVNHAWDVKVNQTARFGRRLAIKVEQSPILQLYKLNVAHEAINADPTERVIEKKSKSPNGSDECNDSDHPTCPLQKNLFDDSHNKDSSGFCCFCNKNGTKASRSEKNCGKGISSAHCIKLSDFWYSSYELKGPVVDHQVSVRLYVMKENEEGIVEWTNLTLTPAILSYPGPYNEESIYRNDWKMRAAYRKENEFLSPEKHYLDSIHHRILIPKFYEEPIDVGTHVMKRSGDEIPPQFKGSFGEKALVVNRSRIDKTGDSCDKVGVFFHGFKQQNNPCDQPIGSCLKNQPFALWKNEKNRLRSFGPLNSKGPLKEIKNDVYIAFDHKEGLTSFIDFEVVAGELLIMRPGYLVGIVSAKIDFGASGGKVLAEVQNRDLAPASFHVRLVKCDEKLIPHMKSKAQTIAPRHQARFTINVRQNTGTPKPQKATCILVVVNRFNEIVAARQVLFSSDETCICNYDCKCTCQSDDFQCKPLEKRQFHAAGFTKRIYDSEIKPKYSIVIVVIVYILLIILVLLALGMCKWLLGTICKPISSCGLCYFNNKPRKISNNMKDEFGNRKSEIDSEGYIVDSKTKKPLLKRLTPSENFNLNAVFFLCFPFFICPYLTNCCIDSPSDKKGKKKSKYFSSSDEETDTDAPTNYETTTAESDQCGVPIKKETQDESQLTDVERTSSNDITEKYRKTSSIFYKESKTEMNGLKPSETRPKDEQPSTSKKQSAAVKNIPAAKSVSRARPSLDIAFDDVKKAEVSVDGLKSTSFFRNSIDEGTGGWAMNAEEAYNRHTSLQDRDEIFKDSNCPSDYDLTLRKKNNRTRYNLNSDYTNNNMDDD